MSVDLLKKQLGQMEEKYHSWTVKKKSKSGKCFPDWPMVCLNLKLDHVIGLRNYPNENNPLPLPPHKRARTEVADYTLPTAYIVYACRLHLEDTYHDGFYTADPEGLDEKFN